MTDLPRVQPTVIPPIIDDMLHAPVIYCDTVPAFGLINGVVAITLAAGRWLEINGALQGRPVVVGHLRMTLDGAAALRDALDKAILAGRKVEGGTN